MPEQMGVINFGAGPAKIPPAVVQELSDALNPFQEAIGILEMSHRSKKFTEIIQSGESKIRSLAGVGDEHSVLFMQGGGTLQFAAAPLNLIGDDKHIPLYYLITGHWSRQAAFEAINLGYNVQMIELIEKDEAGRMSFIDLAITKDRLFEHGNPHYLYYCDNETIDGIEFPTSTFVVDSLGIDCAKTRVVCDMSSNFLSRLIETSKFSLIFATAQKNIGPSGVTVVILQRGILQKSSHLPKMLDYSIFEKHKSLYNTPPCFSVFAVERVLAWLTANFESLEQIDQFSREKASVLYAILDTRPDIFINKVPSMYRSRMNVVWQFVESKKEAEFLALAESKGMQQLKGHRSVGGLRASLYNAITLTETRALVDILASIPQTN